MDPNTHLHWNTTTHQEIAAQYEAIIGTPWPYGEFPAYNSGTLRIANTGVVADVTKQTRATIPVTHYFDLERICRDCDRKFIFFAAEQKHWYEDLGFGLESDCVRCVPCRKRQQGIARNRERYEELFGIANRTADQDFEMAECCLSLIDDGIFTRRQLERVRMLLNRIHKASDGQADARYREILDRLRSLEAQDGHEVAPPNRQ